MMRWLCVHAFLPQGVSGVAEPIAALSFLPPCCLHGETSVRRGAQQKKAHCAGDAGNPFRQSFVFFFLGSLLSSSSST